VTIVVWPWGAYLGEEGLERGIRAKISSFQRHHVNAAMTKAKVCGFYVNSILAKREVMKDGYDEAILLDAEGFIAEASGENVFMVRDGVLRTPPPTNVLLGITRDSILRIAADKGIPVEERRFTRDELYTADEAFLTGTAAEVTPIREVDNRGIGEGRRGPVTSVSIRVSSTSSRGRTRSTATGSRRSDGARGKSKAGPGGPAFDWCR
jgi:branched-chain amino acid aminotransferase